MVAIRQHTRCARHLTHGLHLLMDTLVYSCDSRLKDPSEGSNPCQTSSVTFSIPICPWCSDLLEIVKDDELSTDERSTKLALYHKVGLALHSQNSYLQHCDTTGHSSEDLQESIKAVAVTSTGHSTAQQGHWNMSHRYEGSD